jgi:hypothetical protein
MGDEDLALLQKLAVKPTRYVPSSMRRQVIAALESGHVTFGPHGWIATRQGLAEIERHKDYPQAIRMARCNRSGA